MEIYDENVAALSAALRAINSLINFLSPSRFPPQYLSPQIEAIHSIALTSLDNHPHDKLTQISQTETSMRYCIQQIVRLTSEETRKAWFYCGNEQTFTYVWSAIHTSECPAENDPNNPVPVRLGELDGPLSCEHMEIETLCSKECWVIYVPEEQFESIPYRSGPALI